MDDNENIGIKIFGYTLAGIATVALLAVVIAASYLWHGFVLQNLWNWFAPPFTDVRLSLPMAIGLGLLIGQIKGYRYRKSEEGNKALLFAFLAPTIMLIVGYIAHRYI